MAKSHDLAKGRKQLYDNLFIFLNKKTIMIPGQNVEYRILKF